MDIRGVVTMQNNQGVQSAFPVQQVVQAILRNILLVILAAMVCGATVFGILYSVQTPVYKSTVTVFYNFGGIRNLNGTSLLVFAADDPVLTYDTLIRSMKTLEEIKDTSGVSYSLSELSGMISTEPIEDTSFMNINVLCGNPNDAELIANTVAKVLPNRVADIVDGSTLRVVDYAVVPSSRSTNDLQSGAIIGAVGGVLLVCLIIALKTYIQYSHAPVIESSTELADFYPEIPLLGIIRDLSYSDRKYEKSEYGSSRYGGYYKKSDDSKKEEK